jgi:uncharacterized protein YfiM (DUF2279 family)
LLLVSGLIQTTRAQDSTRQGIYLYSLPVDIPRASIQDSDTWFGEDKFRHVVGSMICTTLLIQITADEMDWNKNGSEIVAVGTTLSLGFVKELYDRQRPGNHFCWKDLTANVAGILLGWAVTRIH